MEANPPAREVNSLIAFFLFVSHRHHVAKTMNDELFVTASLGKKKRKKKKKKK